MSELAILLTAAWWQSQAEWQIHEPIARSSGLSDDIIEALQAQHTPTFVQKDEAIVYHLGEELYRTRRVSDERYQEAVDAFGEPAVVELVAIFGYYALVAMTLNVFAVQRPTTTPLPFSEP
ncbi:hypothetical protein [Pseudomonas amygdali]|uniref:carboxymuconolactone decarboxylase family protein n=1 Tax=Pseudomonas amygdali TaxID=47877 RepID=UPI002D21AD6D|nr:hypothetical protein [Pseudomonas amygdali]